MGTRPEPETGGQYVEEAHAQGPSDRGPGRGRIREGRADRAAAGAAVGGRGGRHHLAEARTDPWPEPQPAGDPVRVDRTSSAGAGDYDGLLVPGGFINPDLLRQSAPARGLVSDFVESGKPVVTLCHGPWVLASAGVLQGRTLTSWAGIRDDVVNAGATWLDQEVVRDGNLTTSRGPQDLAAFVPAMLETFAAGPLAATTSGRLRVGPAAQQPARPRDGSNAMVTEAVDHRRGWGRPCSVGETDRPARRRTRSHHGAESALAGPLSRGTRRPTVSPAHWVRRTAGSSHSNPPGSSARGASRIPPVSTSTRRGSTAPRLELMGRGYRRRQSSSSARTSRRVTFASRVDRQTPTPISSPSGSL